MKNSQITVLLCSMTMLGLTTTSCDKNKEEGMKVDKTDIATHVSVLGRPIILADRNVGATEIGGNGIQMTFNEALTACPKGYHMMTQIEAEALTTDSRYNTPQKFVSAFKIPLSQYIIPKNTKLDTHTRAAIDITKVAALHLLNTTLLINTDPALSEFIYAKAPSGYKMNLRCVKGEAVQSLSGSFLIMGDITMTPHFAQVKVNYTDNTQSTIRDITLQLDGAVNQNEKISLLLTPEPAKSDFIIVQGDYYKNEKHVVLDDPTNTNNTRFSFDPVKRTFVLSLDSKNGATQIIKGGVQGIYTNYEILD